MSTLSAMRRLAITKMARDAVDDARNPKPALAQVLDFIMSRERMLAGARAADQWARNAVSAVREAGEPNPWKTATDEEIATELLRRNVAYRAKEKPRG